MFTPGSYQALAAVGRFPEASFGPRRWRQGAVPAPLPMSTMASRRSLVSRAAISIPPDALVHPFRKTFGSDDPRWEITKVEKAGNEDEKVKLRFLVKDEVEVDLPHDSNVLTIKKKNMAANDDELLDVRLLLTADYSRDGIKVEKGKDDDGKMFLEVTIIRKVTDRQKIDIY